jgi:dephospho-CoA kinase
MTTAPDGPEERKSLRAFSSTPIVVGLTGGIASGKNQVAEMLDRLGAEVIDADEVSRQLVEPGRKLLAQLVELWGPEILDADGRLDRADLAARVFERPEEVLRLNAATHPAILEELARRIQCSECGVVVVMAPLLLEAGAERLVHEVWVLRASPGVRLRRLLARDAITEAQARQRMAAQLTEAERAARADVVLDNEGDLDALRQQVEREWARLDTGLRSSR